MCCVVDVMVVVDVLVDVTNDVVVIGVTGAMVVVATVVYDCVWCYGC